MKQIRQGDVFLMQIDKLPENIKPKNNVLAYGEVTGHSHRFEESKLVQVYQDDNNDQYIDVQEEQADLIHEEHHVLQIPKGMYKVVLQRELDILSQVRQVMD
jgi:hypothetical protein